MAGYGASEAAKHTTGTSTVGVNRLKHQKTYTQQASWKSRFSIVFFIIFARRAADEPNPSCQPANRGGCY